MTLKKSFSTDDYDPARFRPHGRISFTKDNDILICEATGPFNEELLRAIAAAESGMLPQMQQYQHWADIVVIKKSALASKETLAQFTAYLTSLGRQNLNATVTALVIEADVEGAAVMTSQIVDAYMDAGINLTVFNNLHNAKVFVKLHL